MLSEQYQFKTLAKLARERNSCFHPLGHNAPQLDAEAVAEARATISTSPEFGVVRASSLLLVRVLESWLSAPPPAKPIVPTATLEAAPKGLRPAFAPVEGWWEDNCGKCICLA